LRGDTDLVDIGNAFAKIEFSVFRAVTAFNFDKGGGGFRVAFSAGEGDVLATHIESVEKIRRDWSWGQLPVLSLWHCCRWRRGRVPEPERSARCERSARTCSVAEGRVVLART
jgi:hypothetical protein